MRNRKSCGIGRRSRLIRRVADVNFDVAAAGRPTLAEDSAALRRLSEPVRLVCAAAGKALSE